MTDIRRFMNLVESRLLTEATNYADMFKAMVAALPEDQHAKVVTDFQNEIKWAKSTLKKNDRIVWYLRWFKIVYMVSNIGRGKYEIIDTMIDKEVAVIERKGSWGRGNHYDLAFLASKKSEIEHFLSLPIHEIQNLVWRYQSPEELMIEFRKAERRWQESRKGLIVFDEETILIQFPNDFAWVHLPRAYCTIEGDAMGHCGNKPSHKPGETILSLRQAVVHQGARFWRPHATFILDRNGVLGEMKGRDNEKPLDEHHPHIIALLRHDIIKGIKGGGYDAQNNFDLDDLDRATREALLDDKPNLGSLKDIYRTMGLTPELNQRIVVEVMDLTDEEPVLSGNKYIIDTYEGFASLLQSHGDREAKLYAKYLEHDEYMDVENGNAESLFDDLPRESQKKIGIHLAAKYPEALAEWEEENAEDYSPVHDAFRFLSHLDDIGSDDDELLQGMETASRYGIESGTFSAVSREVKRAIEDAEFRTDGVFYEIEGEHLTPDVTINLMISAISLIDVLSSESSRAEVREQGFENGAFVSIDVPRYGFEGYDKDYALESFFDNHPDFKPEAQAV
jgi:hypothetical protein